MPQRIFALLDHHWVTRASNVVFLGSVAIFIGTRVFDALQHVDWLMVVVYVGIALGLGLMLLEQIGKRRERPLPEPLRSNLLARVWTKQQEDLDQRAEQIVKGKGKL